MLEKGKTEAKELVLGKGKIETKNQCWRRLRQDEEPVLEMGKTKTEELGMGKKETEEPLS